MQIACQSRQYWLQLAVGVNVDVAFRGEDVVVKSRAGSFRIVPIKEDDIVVNKRDLAAELRSALIEAKESMEGKRTLNTRFPQWGDPNWGLGRIL